MKNIRSKVDLHGVKHEEVRFVLEEYLFWQKKDNVEIITGNSDRMRDLVIDWLEHHNYDYLIEAHNTGCIKIL
jgi:DNA-nicking Smr family endonuclease